jgi:hypothetical protein
VNRPVRAHSLFIPVFGGLIALALVGCGNQEEITRYTVTRAEQPATQDRILAAAVPQGDQMWFFKLTGPSDAVAGQAEAFAEFIRSIRFSAGERPQPAWTLPAGWQEQPGSNMRFATITIATDKKPLELTVIPLPNIGDDEQQYLADNINRWRDQLGLPAISSEQMFSGTGDEGGAVKQFEVNGTTVTLANLIGKSQSTGMGRAPFAGGAGPFAGGAGAPALDAPSSRPQATTLTYETPQGWTEEPASGLRHAAFTVSDGDHKILITAITLPPAGGDLLENVNRWRKEIKLATTTSETLPQELEAIEIDQTKGHLVELIGPEDASPRTAIIGAIVPHGGQVWFFTLKGDAELAQREKANFRSFVESVKFSKADGVGNGK